MSNSKLINCTVLSPNHSGKRTHAVDRITPHCVVGQLSARAIGNCFPKGRPASCNYGIGTEGDVCLVVDEANRSWCSSNSDNDNRAITIECASDKVEPYTMNSKVYSKLSDLCVDICKRYGKKKLLWIPDKAKALAYKPKADEMLLTVHRWFASKSCPGNWLFSRLGKLAEEVTEKLGGASVPKQSNKASGSTTIYKVQIGAFTNKANAEALLKKAKVAGFSNAHVEQSKTLFKVQAGDFASKAEADKLLIQTKSKGFTGSVVADKPMLY